MPIPDKVGSDIESLPMPEEKDFRDYILILFIFMRQLSPSDANPNVSCIQH
ncbi:conserved hypothetical Protein [Photorhabdus asymbiotica]|uniref:Pyosin/cloacin translocation domain-containing protein n=1 Tax=Photorhabdus asymbiotica subsp. asymbiotica (strain ATCC 43949 / 3105-77) TaxID=553480 RepID=B6VLB0_PHOAA|nr:conserved hypothetical Protein [Photorhabdus asymbiotica]CAR66940.1 Hypothetical Protein PA-RVA7-0642 [Photorhabdus asymbiotica subsp. asymbiotica ATCC 43949]